ncbi:MAG: YigZ family protein [Christensenella sp.]|nr:YigZ family protein [Christensenella sp.]
MQDSKGLRPYQTILTTGESEILINKSRFLGYCLQVSSEQEAQQALARIRKRHYDARHCCYAFRLAEGGVARSSDDGEPSGTAGAPILSVLNGAQLENVLCAVVRYFGGVLLGTGGLVRAYGRAATEAIGNARIAKMQLCALISVDVSYPSYRALEPMIRAKGYDCQPDFGERVKLMLTLPSEEADAFSAAITERTDGAAIVEILGEILKPCPIL